MSSTRTKRTARRSTSDQASPTSGTSGIVTTAADTPQSPNGTLGLLLGLAEVTSLTKPMHTTTLPAPAQSIPTAIATLQPTAGAPVINSYTTLARPPFPAATTTYSSILSQRPVTSAASSHTKAATLFSNPPHATVSITTTTASLSAPLSAQQLDDSLRASLNAKAAAQAKSNAAAAAAAAVAAASSSAAIAPIHANYPAPASLQPSPPTPLPVAAPLVQGAAAGTATASKPAGRRQKTSAVVDAVPPTKSEKGNRASAYSAAANSNSFEGGTGHVDKQKKRLLRKAELARASRRRKKAYVGDLESKCAQLIAQSGYLLSLINKTPTLLAAVRYDAQRLPPGLSFEPTTGLLKCHIDVQRDTDGSDAELDGDSADSDADVEPASSPYEPSNLDNASVAPASSVAPSDLVVLAHAMAEVGATGGSLNEIPAAVATPGPVLAAHPSRTPHLSSLFIPVSSSPPATASPPIAPQQQPAIALPLGGTVSSPPAVVAAPSAAAASSAISDHVVIKCSFRGEWRRFTIPAAQFTFPHLQQSLHDLLLSDSLPASSAALTTAPLPSSLVIKYVDDQGDEILIRSTAELLDARKFSETLVKDESHVNVTAAAVRAANDCLRLYVTESSPSSTAAVVPSTPNPPASTQNHKRKSVEPDLFVKSEASEEKMMDEEKKVSTPVTKESLSKRPKLEASAAN